MLDIPLITSNDVTKLINSYLDHSDLQYHDVIAGFVPKIKYNQASDGDKKFIRLKICLSDSLKCNYYKESCGFLVKLSKFNPELLDRIYQNRKLLMVPQQLISLISEPKRRQKMRIFWEYIVGRTSIDSITKHLSDYIGGRINLVFHDV